METKQRLDFLLESFLHKKPNISYLSDYNPCSGKTGENEWSSIQALVYDGAEINEKKTKVFAYIGFPENADKDSKVPAMVLVHGGGGHAFAEWIKIWNDRGYAAISMDTTGFFPSASGKNIAGRESDNLTDYWHYGMYGDFLTDDYADAPNNDGMCSSKLPIEEQWMYHAISRVILAHNILRDDERILPDKIGLTGISWGGVISSLVIGYDPRFAFAIPVYGSGFLGEGISNIQNFFKILETRTLWLAEERFNRIKFPVFWLAWSKDPCFSIHSNSLSYLATKNQNSLLSLQSDMGHSHYNGWIPPEIYRFADSVIFKKESLPYCLTEPQADKTISFTIKVPADTLRMTATVFYLTEAMTYSLKPEIDSGNLTIDQTWQRISADVGNDTITARLPDNAANFYVEITTETPEYRFITSSSYVELEKGE